MSHLTELSYGRSTELIAYAFQEPKAMDSGERNTGLGQPDPSMWDLMNELMASATGSCNTSQTSLSNISQPNVMKFTPMPRSDGSECKLPLLPLDVHTPIRISLHPFYTPKKAHFCAVFPPVCRGPTQFLDARLNNVIKRETLNMFRSGKG